MTDLGASMTGTSSALYVLDESPVEIEPSLYQLRVS